MFKHKAKTFKYQVDGLDRSSRGRSIKWRIFAYFLIFALIMLILLWLVQTVFLDTIYKSIKTNTIQQISSEVGETLLTDGFGSDAMSDIMNTVAQNNYMCVMVADLNSSGDGLSAWQTADVTSPCVIHHLMANEVKALSEAAGENGGRVLYELDYSQENITAAELAGILGDRYLNLVPHYGKNYDLPMVLLSVSLVQSDNGEAYAVLVNGTVTPLNATVGTLRYQLVVISGVMVLIGLILALLVSERISRPIIHINKLSKRLAQGDFDVDFSVPDAYAEVGELAQTLNHAATELGRTEQLQKDLIANISHDLRTPLTLITAYAEAMRDLPGENTPENVQVIIDETERLSTLVNDLLDMSKLQAGVIELDRREFDLTALVRQIIDRFNKLTATEGYTIVFEPSASIWVNADEIKLTQVIYNLINNAITYTGGDKTVKIRQLVQRDGKVRIEVADSGEGIDPAQIQDIWQRYYHGSANHQRTHAGNGLGLSIVKNILDLHGGAYGVESTPGVGSVFWFELPVLREVQ